MKNNIIKFKIIRLPVNRWKEYRTLRLIGLKTDPQAFGRSLREAKKYPDKFWKDALRKSTTAKEYVVFFAECNQKLVGMFGLTFLQGDKIKHRAKSTMFYVLPAFRGMGIGSALFKEAMRTVKQKRRIKKIESSVNFGQEDSLRLHQKNGFKIIGIAKKEIKIGNKFYDQYLLEKIL